MDRNATVKVFLESPPPPTYPQMKKSGYAIGLSQLFRRSIIVEPALFIWRVRLFHKTHVFNSLKSYAPLTIAFIINKPETRPETRRVFWKTKYEVCDIKSFFLDRW